MAVTEPGNGAAQLEDSLGAAIRDLARRNGAFQQRVTAAGLAPDDLRSVADLSRLPVVDKDELREQQHADPPFGGLLSDGEQPRRVFQSPGPLYEPEPAIADPWRFREALEAATFTADDVVLNAFGYHLSPAGAMFEEASTAIGATVVPAGVGSRDLQVRACVDLGVTAYIGTPSYLKALLETAEDDGQGGRIGIAKAFVSAEPLPPSLRSWLTERVPVVRQGYGTAEAGSIAFECEQLEGMHVAGGALVQVCDLTTGDPVEGESPGQVVVTLARTDYPIVRFGTGDLSAWMREPCPCGRPAPRLRGWLGRVGQAVKVRGMFVHPSQVDDLMTRLPGVERYRVQVTRTGHKDEIRCEVVATGDADDDLAASVERSFADALRLRCDVDAVPSLPPDAERFEDLRTWD